MAMSLPEALLDALVQELGKDPVVGIILGGSHARGEATPYSDVDLACFVEDSSQVVPKWFQYRDGYLVSVGTKAIPAVHRDMRRPNMAIWVVPGLANSRILLDKHGSVGALLRELREFQWEPLQEAANRHAGTIMMWYTETVHKILSENLKGDRPSLGYATWNLLTGLTEAMAVQRGVMVVSDSTYYHQVQEAVGPDAAWSRYHLLAAGTGEGAADGVPVEERSSAALCLYRETLRLLTPVIDERHRLVAEQAVRVIDEALAGRKVPNL